MTTQPKPQPHKKLIVFPQDKGGIGKSFVATLLYDYLAEQGIKLKTFDLDHANSTFQRFVPEAQFIDTDVDANKLAVLDTVVNSLETADVALVDTRGAGTSIQPFAWHRMGWPLIRGPSDRPWKEGFSMQHDQKQLHQIAQDYPWYTFTVEEVALLCNVSRDVVSKVRATADNPFFLNKCRPEWFTEWMRLHPGFQLTKCGLSENPSGSVQSKDLGSPSGKNGSAHHLKNGKTPRRISRSDDSGPKKGSRRTP